MNRDPVIQSLSGSSPSGGFTASRLHGFRHTAVSAFILLATYHSRLTSAADASDFITSKPAGLANSMVAAADDNSAITSNPAGMSQWERYALAFAFNTVPGREREFVGSIVDSETQPVAAGVAYVRHYEPEGSGSSGRGLHRGHLALSYDLLEGVYLGGGVKYLRMTRDIYDFIGDKIVEKHEGFTGDAGFLWAPFEYGALGLAAYNVVEVKSIFPEGRREISGGISAKYPPYVLATGHVKEVPFEKSVTQWGAALQLTLEEQVDFRGGYLVEKPPDQPEAQNSITFGAAWNAPKATLGAGVQRELKGEKNIRFSVMVDVHF